MVLHTPAARARAQKNHGRAPRQAGGSVHPQVGTWAGADHVPATSEPPTWWSPLHRSAPQRRSRHNRREGFRGRLERRVPRRCHVVVSVSAPRCCASPQCSERTCACVGQPLVLRSAQRVKGRAGLHRLNPIRRVYARTLHAPERPQQQKSLDPRHSPGPSFWPPMRRRPPRFVASPPTEHRYGEPYGQS